MLNILIVDDDSTKIKNIVGVIKSFSSIDHNSITKCLDINDARNYLYKNKYDLLILDIQLPQYLGNEINKEGGITLLNEIKSVGKIKKPTYIIGITSYEDTVIKSQEKFIEDLWNVLEYTPQYNKWEKQLTNRIDYLLNVKNQELENREIMYDYDLAIITAVEIESAALLNLDANWVEKILPNDPTLYKEGQFQSDGRCLKVVTAQQHQMGMPSASALTMKMIYNFRPKYIVMVGICAGNKNQGLNFGDIVIASESWDSGSGKIKADSDGNYTFLPEPHQLTIDIELKEKFQRDFEREIFEIRKKWPSNKPEILKLKVGPLASGAAVIQDESHVVEYIEKHNRKLVGIDMETYGMYFAANNCSKPKPLYFSIKSVSDFADKEKNDNYQAYAAYTSAQFLYYLAINELEFAK